MKVNNNFSVLFIIFIDLLSLFFCGTHAYITKICNPTNLYNEIDANEINEKNIYIIE